MVAALACPSVWAVQACDIDGQHVNPNNGHTTQGKTGLMRCRDGEGGPLVREQELKDGVFMGAVRYWKDGQLEREHRVNARGNRDGLSREYALVAGAAKSVLVREETLRDGRTVGLARSWHPNGALRRVSFHGDDEREQASAEFTAQGQLSELSCAPRPVLAPDFDDAKACGHGGSVSAVSLYGGKGQVRARLAYERGDRRRSEQLWESGSVRELQEIGASGGVERSFAADGTKRREVVWVMQERPAGERPRRIVTLEQQHHESGKLVQEKRWRPVERGSELVSEQTWYLNGQPKQLTEFATGEGKTLRRDTTFHDNGRKASEGVWTVAVAGRRSGELATGVHRSWDADGRLRSERSHDEKGRISRERELDGNGAVVRDDEVFEDGSRKAFGR